MSRKKKHKENKVIFSYTQRLEGVLMDISDNISFAILGSYLIETNSGIKLLDFDSKDHFKIYKNKDKSSKKIHIKQFLTEFFGEAQFSEYEIRAFLFDYNKKITQGDLDCVEVDMTPFQEKFIYNPKDVTYTFKSLCYQTYPYGTEEAILKFIDIPLEADDFGNYYIKIGESNTMFTSHFDSACKIQDKVKILSFQKEEYTFLCSDGSTILSGDDKAGVTVMLYMIAHNIPGLYYFFVGEEVGGIGSGLLSKNYDKFDYLKGIKKCISFDRRNYHSIITHQSLTRTCSDEFAESLCQELINQGLHYELDNTGAFTDSANFINVINECTNISVGYFKEHTTGEYVNITFLEQLCKACINIDWENLTINRKIGYNREIVERHYDMLKEFKSLSFYNEVKLKAFNDRIFMQLKTVESPFMENYEDVSTLNTLFRKYDLNPYIYISDNSTGMLMNIEIE
jgi:hypothetical protein